MTERSYREAWLKSFGIDHAAALRRNDSNDDNQPSAMETATKCIY